MNKQQLNKILIAILVVIWGFVGFNFFSNYSINDSIVPLENPDVILNNISSVKSNRFQLAEISRDPFLGNYIVKEKKGLNKSIKKKRKVNKKLPWPRIEYFGYVKNENSKKPLVLLKVNGRVKRTRKGEKLEGFVINSVYNDSIIISMGKEKRVIKKKSIQNK